MKCKYIITYGECKVEQLKKSNSFFFNQGKSLAINYHLLFFIKNSELYSINFVVCFVTFIYNHW